MQSEKILLLGLWACLTKVYADTIICVAELYMNLQESTASDLWISCVGVSKVYPVDKSGN